jgi:hypothetical protein
LLELKTANTTKTASIAHPTGFVARTAPALVNAEPNAVPASAAGNTAIFVIYAYVAKPAAVAPPTGNEDELVEPALAATSQISLSGAFVLNECQAVLHLVGNEFEHCGGGSFMSLTTVEVKGWPPNFATFQPSGQVRGGWSTIYQEPDFDEVFMATSGALQRSPSAVGNGTPPIL